MKRLNTGLILTLGSLLLTGFIFTGCDSSSGSGSSDTGDEPGYTLSFDANGGSGTMESLTVAQGATITLPENTFTRENYAFSRWYTGSGFAYEAGAEFTMGSGDVTLYAEWTRLEKILHASDMQEGDKFGISVSISGDYAIVGASSEDGGSDDSTKNAGAAYIYKNDGSNNWTQVAVLHASDMQTRDSFGFSVSIDGDYAIVGAYREDGGTDDPASAAGAAYIFKNNGSDNWTEVDILHASDMQASDNFGYSVSIDAGYAIVGAYMEDGGTDDPASAAGAAYIFKNDGSDNWTEVDILHASDIQADDNFGYSVSIDAGYAIVGAYREDGGTDDPASAAGAAYIFKNDGSDNWTEVDILHASDMQINTRFGNSVDINGDYIIAGAYMKDSGTDDPASAAGAAYIFKNDGTDNWTEVDILHASDYQAEDFFGYSVSIDGDYVIVGTYQEDGEGVSFTDAGAAYIYKNDGSDNWTEVDILHASDMQAGDNFGRSVSIDGDYVIVGTYQEDGGTDDPASDAGAAYIYYY